MITLLWITAVFLWTVPGLGLMAARRLRLAPADHLLVVVLSGVVFLGLGGEALHLCNASPASWRILAAVAAVGWACGWRQVQRWWSTPASRILLVNWLLVSAGSLVALAVIRTYSGGDWIGDWVGHYHRAQYFLNPSADSAWHIAGPNAPGAPQGYLLNREAGGTWLFAYDPFTARPPLLNLATAALLADGQDTFSAYQIITSLLGTTAVLPLGRLVMAAGGRRRALLWLPLVLLANPLFMENTTYAWTKVGSASFVLAAIWSFHRAVATRRVLNWQLAALFVTAGMLAHYSAGPYAVVLSVGYFYCNRERWKTGDFRREIVRVAVPAAVLASTWLLWAVIREGLTATLESNTSVQQAANLSGTEQWKSFLGNFWRSLVPPPWPGADYVYLQHANTWASVRDLAFAFYQTCLPGMVGLAGLVVLGGTALRRRVRPHAALVFAVAATIVIGVAVHPAQMRWGASHICLQPLALAGLALATAWLPRLSRGLWVAVGLAVAVDLFTGIGIHLMLERLAVTPTVLAMQEGSALRAVYGLALTNNAAAKYALGIEMLGDEVPLVATVVAGAAVLLFALARLRQARS